jgi:histidyl-tRNA synthetase
MKQKPLKGTRDFLPHEMERREFIFSTIAKLFQRYGFMQIQTPSMERLSTLTGKYGDEGDRLIFKILNSGDFLRNIDPSGLSNATATSLLNQISDKALRYDLTVPFARFVASHQHEIQFPFKRYQIQPVWRADRPQRGRYQEFYQCDADAIGSTSLLLDIEMIHLIYDVLTELGLHDFTIKLNNRKILSGLTQIMGIEERFGEYAIIIDKQDKMGLQGVVELLEKANMPMESVDITRSLFKPEATLDSFAKLLDGNNSGEAGLQELSFIMDRIRPEVRKYVLFEPGLARGLEYYTGSILEVVSNAHPIGSICGGGRYDNLTELFGVKGMSGIGISFGADRLYDVLTALKLFPDFEEKDHRLLFVNFGAEEADWCMNQLTILRSKGIKAEVYPDNVKMGKQMKYANDRNIQWVALVGEDEMKTNRITLKNMKDGSQETLSLEKIIPKIIQ